MYRIRTGIYFRYLFIALFPTHRRKSAIWIFALYVANRVSPVGWQISRPAEQKVPSHWQRNWCPPPPTSPKPSHSLSFTLQGESSADGRVLFLITPDFLSRVMDGVAVAAVWSGFCRLLAPGGEVLSFSPPELGHYSAFFDVVVSSQLLKQPLKARRLSVATGSHFFFLHAFLFHFVFTLLSRDTSSKFQVT